MDISNDFSNLQVKGLFDQHVEILTESVVSYQNRSYPMLYEV